MSYTPDDILGGIWAVCFAVGFMVLTYGVVHDARDEDNETLACMLMLLPLTLFVLVLMGIVYCYGRVSDHLIRFFKRIKL